jgi:hypothetical protein
MERPGVSNRINQDKSNRGGDGEKETDQRTRSRPEPYFRPGAERLFSLVAAEIANLKEPLNPVFCRQYQLPVMTHQPAASDTLTQRGGKVLPIRGTAA